MKEVSKRLSRHADFIHICIQCQSIFLNRGVYPSIFPQNCETYGNMCSFQAVKEARVHRSCNSEDLEYFTGNACGEPQKTLQICSARCFIHRSDVTLRFSVCTLTFL